MAYELIFVPRMLAQSWAEAIDASSRAAELTSPALVAARLEPWPALAAAIRARLAELGPAAGPTEGLTPGGDHGRRAVGAWATPYGPVAPVVPASQVGQAGPAGGVAGVLDLNLAEYWGVRQRELLHRPSGLRLSLFGGEAVLSLPYWHAGQGAERLVRLVMEIGALVESVTGLVGYDPRLRRGLDELSAGELLAGYCQARDAFGAAVGARPAS